MAEEGKEKPTSVEEGKPAAEEEAKSVSKEASEPKEDPPEEVPQDEESKEESQETAKPNNVSSSMQIGRLTVEFEDWDEDEEEDDLKIRWNMRRTAEKPCLCCCQTWGGKWFH